MKAFGRPIELRRSNLQMALTGGLDWQLGNGLYWQVRDSTLAGVNRGLPYRWHLLRPLELRREP